MQFPRCNWQNPAASPRGDAPVFPSIWARLVATALGVTLESLRTSGFSNLEINPVDGVLRFTIAGDPGTAGSPSLSGKHLVYLPEPRSEKKGGGVRRWQCGSDDIPREDRPYRCRHDTGALAR